MGTIMYDDALCKRLGYTTSKKRKRAAAAAPAAGGGEAPPAAARSAANRDPKTLIVTLQQLCAGPELPVT